jgi:hypothetical protein
MAYNNNQEKDTRPKAPFDLFSLTKWAPSPTNPSKNAMLSLDVALDGTVSFVVRTGDPADKERMKDGDIIKIRVRFEKYEQFVLQFGDMLRQKGPCKYFLVEQVRFRWDKDAGKRVAMDEPRDGIKLAYGKDDNGVVFMALTQYKKTDIEFGFIEAKPEFIFKHGDGAPFSPAENSMIGARAYHKLLTELHTRVLNSAIRQQQIPDQFKPPYVAPQGGGNGGGGYGGNRGGNGGGGGGYSNNSGGSRPAPQAAPSMEDDDVPY